MKEMTDFWANPFVHDGIGLLAGIVISALFYFFAIKRKAKIQYQVLNNSPILERNKLFKITYGDKLLDKLNILDILIINNGKLSFRRNDVAKPVTITLDYNCNIIDIVNILKSNDTIDVSFERVNSNYIVTVSFEYLNPKEGVRFSILNDAYKLNCYKVTAEFLDNKLTNAEDNYKMLPVFFIITISAFILGMVLLVFVKTLAFIFMGTGLLFPSLSLLLLAVNQRKQKIPDKLKIGEKLKSANKHSQALYTLIKKDKQK